MNEQVRGLSASADEKDLLVTWFLLEQDTKSLCIRLKHIVLLLVLNSGGG